MPEVVLHLLVHPTFGRRVEGERQPNRHLWADSCAAIQDAGQRLATHTKRSGGLRDCQPKGFQAQFPEYLTRMRRIVHLYRWTSVVVFIIQVARVSRCIQPAENQSESVGVLRLDPTFTAGGEEAFEPFVSKALDRHTNKCNLCSYG